MYDPNTIPRRSAARLLMSPLAAFISMPEAAIAEGIELDKKENEKADKIAKKLAKAKDKSHQAKEEKEAVHDFQEEILEYLELHNKELDRLGPAESAAIQGTLSAAIIRKRAKARQGDIFIPKVQPMFKRLIAEQLSGPDAQPALKALIEGNPGHDEDSIPVAVKVNGRYPTGAARSTVPASVLATLPNLKDPLQYTFIGRDLILLDSFARLILDFIPDAAPELFA